MTATAELTSSLFEDLPFFDRFPDLFPLCAEEGTHTSWEYGSSSGTGCCPWVINFAPDTACDAEFFVSFYVIFDQETLIFIALYPAVASCPGGGAVDYALYYIFEVDGGVECLSEKTYTYSGTFYSEIFGSGLVLNDTQMSISYDFTGLQVTVTPSGAEYYQCGENADGTPYEEVAPMLMAAVAKAVGPNVRVNMRTPLPLAHPDRCRHLGKRTERKAGCNGWKCAHDCDLGLPAVPGLACQACDKYEADPDYVGQGPKGWLQ